jgi:hypothetical protein
VGCSVNASGLQGSGVQAVGGAVGSSSNSDAGAEASQVTVSHPDAGPAVAPDEAPARPDVVYADAAPISAPDARPVVDVLSPGPDLVVVGRDVLSPGPDLVVASPDVQVVGSPDVRSASDVSPPGPDLIVGTPDAQVGPPDVVVVSDLPPVSGPEVGSATGTVTFSGGRAVGAMTGYAWVARGDQDTISSPMCFVWNSGVCSGAVWTPADSLCMTGSVPIAPSNFSDGWGIEIGVSASVSADVPIAAGYATISMTFASRSTNSLRMMLHRLGDPSTTTYCMDKVASGNRYTLTDFNTACYGTGGVQLTAADEAMIDNVALQVTASETEAIMVTNLCLNSITFGY